MRQLLEKLCTLHHHIHTITRIARSRRLSQFLKGKFRVVLVPADHHDISIKFCRRDILPIIFPPGDQAKLDIQSRVYDELLERLKITMNDEGLVFKKGTVPQLSMDVSIHAECTLLAYHLQHPDTNPYRYFGGSKLSCHGCSIFFTSYNRVAESLSLPRFFIRGCHNKIYLRWPCPFLLSQEEQIRLRDKGPTLDTRVRKEMVDMLSTELAKYVEELRESAEALSPCLSEGTDGNSRRPQGVRVTLDEIVRALPRQPSANAGF